MLRDRLAAAPADPEVRDHALGAYQLVESVRRDVGGLLTDPSLEAPSLTRNHLQNYKRWNEVVRLVESYHLPFIERYNASDKRLNSLCRSLLQQVRWPLPPPLICAFSREYYWTIGLFSLICVPATEETTLLGLPDLCHELAHILLLHHEDALVGDFTQELVRYVQDERQRVDHQRRPPEYLRLYDLLLAQWRDHWIQEFVSDMVATYVTGPAFGWQHIRLFAGSVQAAYFPSFGEDAEHPSDEARLRAILAVLNQVGANEASMRIRNQWDYYLSLNPDPAPIDYQVCYPQTLIESLARKTVSGCQALGLRQFHADMDPGAKRDLVLMMNHAWERFLTEPVSYIGWETQELQALWRELGF